MGLDKYAPRREHKERSQPASRSKLGLLEKHKDYVLRARDFHLKEKRIKILKEKAALRNPDEFYFRMINSKTKDGQHVLTRDENFSQAFLRILRTQDLRYIDYIIGIERKHIANLQESLNLVVGSRNSAASDADEDTQVENQREASQRDHIYFADSKTIHLEMEHADENSYLDTLASFVDMEGVSSSETKNISNNPTGITKSGYSASNDANNAKFGKDRMKMYKELEARLKREAQLEKLRDDLVLQKNLSSKGKKRKMVDAEGKSYYRWSHQRQK